MVRLSFPKVSREYRPELNGLRAVAVLLVLFFHLDFGWMKGGFLGVDVFLVISGYFISRNILYGLQEGRFTFYNFYTKRLRRLFPALIFTLVLALIAGYFLLTTANYERLGQSAIFSSLSISNFFFWNEAGYFNLDSISKPLLHMWSLSLEEQFYLFWPLSLFLLYKYVRRYLVVFIFLFALISVLLCEYFLTNEPEAVFFLIPFRMFEFLIGISCIWFERFSEKFPKQLLEFLFIFGLLLIVYSSVVFDAVTPMPGVLSLIPCIGAMFVILGGKAVYSSWLLKNKPMELIGKASYSIYLIHWPLIVFYKYYTLEDLTFTSQWILAAISLILGFFMWHFIENTFRYARRQRVGIDRVWIGVPVAILCLVLASSFIWKSGGLPNRFSDQLYMTKEEIIKNRERYFEKYRSGDKLLMGNPESGHVIIMGNSHSIDLIYMLRENGFAPRITRLNSLGKCYNFGQSYSQEDEEFCSKQRQKNLSNEYWAVADAIYLHDNWPQLDLEGLREILKKTRTLTKAPIYVFGPKMTYTKDIPDIVHASKTVIPKNINAFAMQFEQCDRKVFINLKLIEEFRKPSYSRNKVFYIDLLEMQGGDNLDSFEVVSSDKLKFLYFDFSHFTTDGAKKLGAIMKRMHPEVFDPKQ